MKKGQAQDLPLHSDHDKTHAINRFNPHRIAAPLRVDPQSDRLSG